MKLKPGIKQAILVPALVVALAPVAQARELYRYTNEEGSVVVGYQIPPQYVAGGYEVLNDEGVVVRVVPRPHGSGPCGTCVSGSASSTATGAR